MWLDRYKNYKVQTSLANARYPPKHKPKIQLAITVNGLKPARHPFIPSLCMFETKPSTGTYPLCRAIHMDAIDPLTIPPTVNPNRNGTIAMMNGMASELTQPPMSTYLHTLPMHSR